MEELIFGSVIVWALGRVLKKKADQPAPGTIDLPRQERTQQNTGPGASVPGEPTGFQRARPWR